MIETTVIIQFILTIALGVIGFFLRGIYTTIQEMASSINKLNERLIRHETTSDSTLRRIENLEHKVDDINEIKLQLSKLQK